MRHHSLCLSCVCEGNIWDNVGKAEGQNVERLVPNVAERVRMWKIRGMKNKYHKKWTRELKNRKDLRKNNTLCIWVCSLFSFFSLHILLSCQALFQHFPSCLKLQLLPVCNMWLQSRCVVPNFLFSAFCVTLHSFFNIFLAYISFDTKSKFLLLIWELFCILASFVY